MANNTEKSISTENNPPRNIFAEVMMLQPWETKDYWKNKCIEIYKSRLKRLAENGEQANITQTNTENESHATVEKNH
jgi:hypothetical protein